MTLDEAIKHAEEVADVCEFEASKYDMTDAYESHVACQEGKCADCPIWETIDIAKENSCSAWVTNHPEEAERIIMQWSSEPPIVTNGMKFREVFGEDMIAILTGEHAPLDDWLDAEYKGGQDEQN